MTKLPLPEPPQNSEQFLHELANYYRALLNYHQRSATLAASRLAHVETLLNLGQPTLEQQATLEPGLDSVIKTTVERQESLTSTQLPSSEQPGAISIGSFLPNLEDLEELLKTNRGKMLHLDYIVRILCGRLADKELYSVKQVVKQLLERGASQGRWMAVPDSPDCWTIDLSEFPELASLPTKGRSRKRGVSRLPGNEKLDRYKNLTEAIRNCLEENMPKAMSINDILDWFYPQGLPQENKKRARQAIRDVVIKKCGQVGCWKRFAVGLYMPYPAEPK
ncbi:hypothetical protein Ple7327_0428 [Pleurocapsa sp. PCC 7327]|uniref:hypothetical protein n=1 Tax=Pleurocapsa sp. PCC 7327 TaxID=118163 RepID=UPI00029F8F78|nr:hypothetical protein [Pleurocapsa sp. PCC 7327]AFY75884.1 hypothetical protein Ple7327_0428 [Pleurocapsa sp. PCC 7327]